MYYTLYLPMARWAIRYSTVLLLTSASLGLVILGWLWAT